MQRLTEKQSAGYDLIDMKGLWCDLYCNEQSIYTCKDCAIDKAIQKLAEYEDLEEQGLLLRLPCKVGDVVYTVDYKYECDCNYDCVEFDTYKCEANIRCEHEYKIYKVIATKFQKQMFPLFGKTIFLTKEEAEAKLKEMEE